MTPIGDLFGEAANLAFGDIGLAVIVLFAGIGIIMWKGNVPLGAILLIGLPFIGALVQATTQDFIVTLFAMALVTIGMMVWFAIGETTKKY